MSTKKIIPLNPNPKGFAQTPDELTPDMFDSPLPVQNSYEFYAEEELGLYVGVWDTTDMIEKAGPYPCDEYMWLLEGEAEIHNNKTCEVEKVQAGEAFIIPKGYDCQWHQNGYLRKYFFISEHPDEPIPDTPSVEGIIIPDSNKPSLPITIAEPFLVSGSSNPKMINQYQDTTGKFFSGIWQCDAFQSSNTHSPYHLFAYVMEGSITLVDEDDDNYVFHAGDAFFIPEGVLCSAQTKDSLRISFAILCQQKKSILA